MAEPIIHSGRESYVGLLAQTVFGTLADETAVPGIIQVIEPPTIDFDMNVRDQAGKLAGGARWRDVLDTQTDTRRASPKIPMSGTVYKDCLPEHLYGFFQNVTEAGTTPFKKVFSWPTDFPAFPDDEGFFRTIIVYHPEEDTSIKFGDAIVQSLSLSCEPRERLSMNAQWVGRGAVSIIAKPEDYVTGWTRRPNEFYFYEDMARFTIDFGDGAEPIYLTGGWSFDFTQDVVLIGHDGSGKFKTYGISNLGGTFKAQVLWDENARTALTNYIGDLEYEVNIGWGHATPGTDDGDLDFAVMCKGITVQNVYDEIMACDIEGTIAGRASDSTLPVVITMADAIDRSWPAV